jgi:hypothetical protein
MRYHGILGPTLHFCCTNTVSFGCGIGFVSKERRNLRTGFSEQSCRHPEQIEREYIEMASLFSEDKHGMDTACNYVFKTTHLTGVSEKLPHKQGATRQTFGTHSRTLTINVNPPLTRLE